MAHCRSSALVVSLALLGCDPGGDDAPAKAAPTEATPAKEEAPAKQDPGPSPLTRARKDVTRHMPEHFAHAHDVMEAVIDGDVEQTRKHATELANHSPKSMPADWFPHVEGMREAARAIEEAPDLTAASAGAGALMRACGSCHAALGKGPKVPDVPMPGTTKESCMIGHKWATERLWYGVVADSDSAWQQGVKAFADRPACPKPGGDPIADPDVFEKMRNQLQEQARAAATAKDLDARARVYGEMLVTCGTCHTSGC